MGMGKHNGIIHGCGNDMNMTHDIPDVPDTDPGSKGDQEAAR